MQGKSGRSRWVSSALIFSLLVGFLGMAPSLQAAIPQVINIGNGSEPKDLDPQKVAGVPEHRLILNLFETLVTKDPKTLAPVGGVAESWTSNKTKTSYTFKLRKNAKWSNGEPVTAKDFIYSWTRLLTPATASEYNTDGFVFKNGKAFYEGKVKDVKQVGFKAVDDYTLQVELEKPTPFFLALLDHHPLGPLHQKTIDTHKDKWTRPENFVGNGAFALKKWDLNKVITMVPNEHYWDRKRVKLTEANWYPIGKQDTEERMFRTGALHVTNEMPNEKIPFWRQKEGKNGVYQEYPYLSVYFYWMNTQKPPMNNPKVRKALAYAVDRTAIVEKVTQGGQKPATSYVIPGMNAGEKAKYFPPATIPKDLSKVAEAKKLLADAGFPDGKGLPTIELFYNTNENHKKIGEAVQQMWKKNLNVNVTMVNQEWKVYMDSLRTGNFQIGRMAWSADFNDPWTYYEILLSGRELNSAKYNNPKYDKILDEASGAEEKKRVELFKQAEEIVQEDFPLIPIYHYTRVYLKSKQVEGWSENIEDFHPLKYVSLKEK